MQVTINELESYLCKLYCGKVGEQSLFMKLVEEMGETAEILNKKSGRKADDGTDLQTELGNELADIIHYTVAIAAVNGLDLNEIIMEKDKKASIKYKREENLEAFISEFSGGQHG
ncbi:MAG: nucleotide pyrophosphohydrolase [Oscillospiraceae bacterium]|nr:nucleotide pyrophosphohydrolase [Oscillospiraceae bacterium]